jgi:hypothetical protein
MSWVRLEDNVMDHPKVIALSAFAFRVWIRAICHCNQHGTRGFVSDRILARIGCTPKVRADLTTPPPGYEHGLFEEATGGLLVHDYAQYQTQHAANKAESGRQGGIKSGESRRRKREELFTSDEANNQAENEARARVPVPTRPDPSRPEKEDPPVGPQGGVGVDGSFEDTERVSQTVRKAAPRSADTDRGSRIERDWKPAEETLRWCQEHGVNGLACVDEFIDHWIEVPGAKGRKISWEGTFKNRVRVLIEQGRAPKVVVKVKLPPRSQEPLGLADVEVETGGEGITEDLFTSFGKVMP